MASTPLFLWDHVAAVVFWVALYGVEVALILSVYARYPDSEQAVSALSLSTCTHGTQVDRLQLLGPSAPQQTASPACWRDSVSPVDQPELAACP